MTIEHKASEPSTFQLTILNWTMTIEQFAVTTYRAHVFHMIIESYFHMIIGLDNEQTGIMPYKNSERPNAAAAAAAATTQKHQFLLNAGRNDKFDMLTYKPMAGEHKRIGWPNRAKPSQAKASADNRNTCACQTSVSPYLLLIIVDFFREQM